MEKINWKQRLEKLKVEINIKRITEKILASGKFKYENDTLVKKEDKK